MPTYGSFKYGEGKYGAAWVLPFTALVGSYRGHRFTMFMNEDGQTQIHDKMIDANATIYLRYLTNGLILKFDPAMDHILIYSPLIDDLQVGDNSNFFLAHQNTAQDFLQLRGADFQDGRELKWDMGMIPFDVSLLLTTGLVADWDAYDPVYAKWAEFGSTITSDANGGSGDADSTPKTLPGGSYRAFILWAGTTDTADAEFYAIVSGGGIYGSGLIGGILSAGQWNYVDFAVPTGGASVYFNVGDGGGAAPTVVGEVITWPLANSKNFPLDVRNQALRLTKQKLRGASK